MAINRKIVEDIVTKLKDAKDIEKLIQIYELILHNREILSSLHLEKTRRFINKLYFSISALNEEDTENKFNNDPALITIFKILIGDLYDHSQTKSHSYNYIVGEKND